MFSLNNFVINIFFHSDLDECKEGVHICNTGERCVNEQGGYRCIQQPHSTATSASALKCQNGFNYSPQHNSCIGK